MNKSVQQCTNVGKDEQNMASVFLNEHVSIIKDGDDIFVDITHQNKAKEYIHVQASIEPRNRVILTTMYDKMVQIVRFPYMDVVRRALLDNNVHVSTERGEYSTTVYIHAAKYTLAFTVGLTDTHVAIHGHNRPSTSSTVYY